MLTQVIGELLNCMMLVPSHRSVQRNAPLLLDFIGILHIKDESCRLIIVQPVEVHKPLGVQRGIK